MFADGFTAFKHTHVCIMNCEIKKYALIIKI